VKITFEYFGLVFPTFSPSFISVCLRFSSTVICSARKQRFFQPEDAMFFSATEFIYTLNPVFFFLSIRYFAFLLIFILITTTTTSKVVDLKFLLCRWVKFEEDVEEGGNRWSKPHVATLSLHSLFELRSLLTSGSGQFS
jgi:hypothetical protein